MCEFPVIEYCLWLQTWLQNNLKTRQPAIVMGWCRHGPRARVYVDEESKAYF